MVSVKKCNYKRILTIIITAIFAFSVVSLAVTKLIYDRVFTRYDTYAQVPEELNYLVENRTMCQFPSGENLLTGYYYGTEDPENSFGLILLTPGFSAGGDDYLWQIQSLLQYGWGVFTFDTTGTLRSEGDSQIGFSQVIPDLEAALKYVENQGRFGYNELVLMGHSRGGYAACCALAKVHDVAAVVSVSGVNSAMEAVMQMSANVAGPVSYGNYGFLWLYQAVLFGTDLFDMQASDVLNQRDVPVLVIHGTRDDRIPVDSGAIAAYQEEIKGTHVEYLFCDAGHTDILYDTTGRANAELMAQIHNFLLHSIDR